MKNLKSNKKKNINKSENMNKNESKATNENTNIKMNSNKDEVPKNKKAINLNKYSNSLSKIEEMVNKLDSFNLDSDLVNTIIQKIDKELSETNKLLSDDSLEKDEIKKIEELYNQFLELNQKFLRKIMFNNPFENFIYSEDENKEGILKDFFEKLNSETHWIDFEDVDYTSTPEKIVKDRNDAVSQELIRIFENNLNIRFTKFQKESLLNDFSNIADGIQVDYNEIMNECKKIKTVTSTKLISRPSYKNFISNSELKTIDPSKKISTIRFNFLNYINLTEKQKRNEIANNLSLHLKSLKEILEEEKEELEKRVKFFIILIACSLFLGIASPMACTLSVITIGSAAAYFQTKLIGTKDRLLKLDNELANLEANNSELIDSTYEKLEETSNELLENDEYKEVFELYKKKKKSKLNKKELQDKIEEQIRVAIINNLNALTDIQKDKIIEKCASNKNESSKGKINEKDMINLNEINNSKDIETDL